MIYTAKDLKTIAELFRAHAWDAKNRALSTTSTRLAQQANTEARVWAQAAEILDNTTLTGK